MANLATVWQDLKAALVSLTQSIYPVSFTNLLYRGSNSPIVWSRDTDAVADGSPGYDIDYVHSFAWQAGSEYEWLTRDYVVQLEIIKSYFYGGTPKWVSKVTIQGRSEPTQATREGQDPLDFKRLRTDFDVSFSSVIYGGVCSAPRPSTPAAFYLQCHDGIPAITTTNVFPGPAKDGKDNTGDTGPTLGAVIQNRNIPAVCTIDAPLRELWDN